MIRDMNGGAMSRMQGVLVPNPGRRRASDPSGPRASDLPTRLPCETPECQRRCQRPDGRRQPLGQVASGWEANGLARELSPSRELRVIPISRLGIALVMTVYTIAYRPLPAFPEPGFVRPASFVLCAILFATGLAQLAMPSRPLRMIFLAVDVFAAVVFVWIYGFDPRRYLQTPIAMVLVEAAMVSGLIGAMVCWGLTSLGYVIQEAWSGWPGSPGLSVAVAMRVAFLLGVAVLSGRLADQLFAGRRQLHRMEATRRALMLSLLSAQEEERKRIAAEIHDDSIQTMVAIGMQLDLIAGSLPEDKRKLLDVLEESLHGAIDRLRRLLFELQISLDRDGLGGSIQRRLDELSRASQLSVELHDELITEPPPDIAVTCYRIAQEALVNAWKHARAPHVRVDISSKQGGVLMQIMDDGVGFRLPGEHGAEGHLGLKVMKERAEMAGGWFLVESEPGAGTTVRYWIPCAVEPPVMQR